MSEWISVKDRLPENDDRVLAYVFRQGVEMACYHINNPELYGKWFLYEVGGTSDDDILYWMPLPEAPNKQEGQR